MVDVEMGVGVEHAAREAVDIYSGVAGAWLRRIFSASRFS